MDRGCADSHPRPRCHSVNAGKTPVRIGIVDDQRIIRAGLRALLETDPDIEVVGEAGTGEGALALAGSRQPDIVLMDIRMPGIDGLEATKRIRAEHPSVDVIVLTTFDLDEYVFAAVRAGAAGFFLKDGDVDELLRAVQVVARGDALMSPTALRRLLAEFAAAPTLSPSNSAVVAELTKREREVLALVGQGLSNTEISEALFISEATTKTHISSLLAKLNARHRAQLVIAAYESGLVRPGERPRGT